MIRWPIAPAERYLASRSGVSNEACAIVPAMMTRYIRIRPSDESIVEDLTNNLGRSHCVWVAERIPSWVFLAIYNNTVDKTVACYPGNNGGSPDHGGECQAEHAEYGIGSNGNSPQSRNVQLYNTGTRHVYSMR